MAGGVGGGGDGATDSKKGLEGTGLDLPENRHDNLNSASSDQNLKDLVLQIKSCKSPAVINYGASWCRVCVARSFLHSVI
ncbi:thioredoxin-like 3-3 [Malus domestica]|uniref:thioredoxin-like 3-3 n=1 Tax=Malus domestica TaxID=3750 RepID=UPI000498CEFC|nr:thioredoxin-like 3-3 [Malus domestica]